MRVCVCTSKKRPAEFHDPIAGVSRHVTGLVTISEIGSVVVKAILTNPGRADSNIASANFLVLERVKTPVFGLDTGTLTDKVTLHLSRATDGVRIRYTIDGQTTNAASPEYVSSIDLGLGQKDVEASYVVNAIAIATNTGDSFVAVSGTVILQPQVQVPVITPDSPGPFTSPLKVTISTSAAKNKWMEGTYISTSRLTRSSSRKHTIDWRVPRCSRVKLYNCSLAGIAQSNACNGIAWGRQANRRYLYRGYESERLEIGWPENFKDEFVDADRGPGYWILQHQRDGFRGHGWQ